MNDKQTDDARHEQDLLLDEALAETFPASDPISMQQVVIVGRVQRPFSVASHGRRRTEGRDRRAPLRGAMMG
jgi:hypothetical protein